MKKVFALLLCLLLLGSTVAFAESAPALSITDPVVTVDAYGDTMSLDLSGLVLRLSVPEGDTKEIAINLYGNEQLLLAAGLCLDGERVLMTAQGLSHTYYAVMPEQTSGSLQGGFKPNVDMEALTGIVMQGLSLSEENGVIHFKLDHSAVTAVAEELLNAAGESVPADSLAEAQAGLAQAKENNTGVSVAGSVQLGDAGFSGELGFYPVNEGQEAETAAFQLAGSFTPEGDNFSFVVDGSIDRDLSGTLAPLFRLDGYLNKSDDGFVFHSDVLADTDESGVLQHVAKFELRRDTRFTMEAQLTGSGLIRFVYDPADGALEIRFTAEDIDVALNAFVTTGTEEITRCTFDAAGAVDVTTLTEEEVSQLQNEAMSATAYLIGFLYPVLANSGMMG